MYRLYFASLIAITFFMSAGHTAWGQAAAGSTPQNESAKKEMEAAVLKELSDMVPGGVAANSGAASVLKEAITLFGSRKASDAKEKLKAFAAENPSFPPADLMTAAVAFAVKDGGNGIRMLEQAAINKPKYPDVNFSFGQVALSQGRLTDADAQAEMGLQKVSSGSFSQTQLDYFKRRYFEIKFLIAKRRNQIDVAKGHLQQLETIAPESKQTLAGKAEMAFEDNDLDQAIVLLKKLNVVSGKDLGPELTIANWFQRKGKPGNANLWIKKASAENMNHDGTQIAAARWAMAREKFRETLEYAKRLEAITGESNATKEIRGKVAFAQGAYTTAQANFTALVTDNPKNADHANMLALSMIQNDDEETQKKALNLAKQVVSSQPNNPVALSSLAYVMLKLGQKETARSIMGKVASLPNPNAEVQFILAYMLAETGQLPQSKQILENSLKTKSLFLFREEAKKLLNSVNQSSQELPARNE